MISVPLHDGERSLQYSITSLSYVCEVAAAAAAASTRSRERTYVYDTVAVDKCALAASSVIAPRQHEFTTKRCFCEDYYALLLTFVFGLATLLLTPFL